MKEYSKLELNAMLERLIESPGEDAEARAVVASIASALQPKASVNLNALIRTKGGKFSGMTPEHGKVEIDNDEERARRLEIGTGTIERVGYYKISRAYVRRIFGQSNCGSSSATFGRLTRDRLRKWSNRRHGVLPACPRWSPTGLGGLYMSPSVLDPWF